MNEFIGKVNFSSSENPKVQDKPIVPIAAATTMAAKNLNLESELSEKEEIRKKAEAEERRKAAERERQSLEKIREENRIARIKKEEALALAAKKKEQEKIKKEKVEQEKAAAVYQTQNNNNSDDGDMFDGCFKWMSLLFLLLLFILALSYFKGCFNGNQDGASASTSIEHSDDASASVQDSLLTNNGSTDGDNNHSNLAQDGNQNTEEDNTQSNNGNNENTSYTDNNNPNISIANCNCSEKAVVFEIPNKEAKSVNRLGTNPQFGNTHGLSSADFFEELKYAAENNSWDRSYLNYLFKAMGYNNGFADAQANQISQGTITPGIKGILGFGKYSGYGYSQLDLKGKDLEVFRIEAANGCHIHFMKTCGNLLFICE